MSEHAGRDKTGGALSPDGTSRGLREFVAQGSSLRRPCNWQLFEGRLLVRRPHERAAVRGNATRKKAP